MIDAAHVKLRSSRIVRGELVAGAAGLAAITFAVDLTTTVGSGISALYVVPLLLATLTGPPRVAYIGGSIASALVVLGLFKIPLGMTPWFVLANRAIALAVIWTTVFAIVRSRVASIRLEERTRDLADVNFALEKSAIVAVTDVRGVIKYVNDTFCQISKYSRGELLGQDHRILNSGYHPTEFIRTLWTTIANGHIWRGEIRNRAKDGSLYWVDTTIVPFLNAAGKPYQYMAIRYEITGRKESEKRLQEQAALARLGEMAAVVAHEVKNPIAGIRGALQVISSRMPPETRDRAVMGDIITRLDGLNGVVQDLLVFARPRELRTEPVDVAALIGHTIDLIRRDPIFAAIDVRIDGSTGLVQADPAQLQLVLQNVLINAAQAMNGQGSVSITFSAAEGRSQMSIADGGPGMPPEVLEHAFAPFFTTKSRGTGLGLPLAKRIIEAHGGEIAIQTPPAGGTAVTLTLPLARIAGSPTATATQGALMPSRIDDLRAHIEPLERAEPTPGGHGNDL
jgi:PAS domain S-box-containing protein